MRVRRCGSRILVLVFSMMVVAASSASAGVDQYERKGVFVLGGGFNSAVGGTAQYLNSSGSFVVGGGANLTRRFTISVLWNHNWLGIDPEVIDRAESDSVQFDNAYASLWSTTLNGTFRLNPDGAMVFYVSGGAGYYKRNIQITQNALVYYPPIWDPWWGWVDGGWGPGEAITGHREANALGGNIGAGFDLEIDNGASLFVSAEYHFAPMDGVDMQIIPILFGVRF